MNPAVTDQLAAGTEESHDAEPTADGQVVVGPMPAQRSGFQPRPALLAQLNRASQKASVLVFTGAWGVGKTQLAAAYARARISGGWRLIAWVNARDRESLLAGLAAVADALRLSRSGSEQGAADVGQSVRHWLETDGNRCLLVFDDAEDPDALRPFLPVGGAARVLITAAQEPVAELGAHIPVEVFSAEEALALLDGRTGLADESGAAAVAAELGHLPLGLDQAAAAIAGQDLSYTAYLAMLRALPAEQYQVREEEQPYPPGLAEAVLLSLEAAWIADRVGVCTGVMEVLAVLSPAVVRRDLLRAAGPTGMLASGGRRVGAPAVDEALAQLEQRSLLGFSFDGQAVIVHHLVARVIRDGLARRGRLTAACRTAASALEASTEALASSHDHPAIRELLGQVAALLDNARERADDADERLTRTLMRLRFLALYHLIELGDSTTQAIAIGEPLIADLKRLLGADHPDTLSAQNSLAAAYHAAGQAAAAIPLFEQILVGRERLLGPDHPDTLTAQNNLAAAYEDAGRLAEAILLYRMTLAARDRVLGADHPGTLNTRGSLAAAYRAAGQAAEAIPLFEQTLAGRERVLGPYHPDTMRSRDSLATAYREAGRVVDFVPLGEQILAARERLLGAGHPSTLASRNNLASAYRTVGRPAEAIPLFEQNLAACEQLLGADHSRTVASRHNLARAREEASRGAEDGPSVNQ